MYKTLTLLTLLILPFITLAQEDPVDSYVDFEQNNQLFSPEQFDELSSSEVLNDPSIVEATSIVVVSGEVSNQGENKFQITFNIENNSAPQSDINYSVELIKQDEEGYQTVIHSEVYQKSLYLDRGQDISQSVDYQAPSYLNGDYKLRLTAGNSQGLTFGHYTMDKVVLVGNSQNIQLNPEECFLTVPGDSTQYSLDHYVDVSPSEDLVLNCIAKNNTSSDVTFTPQFIIRHESKFGNLVDLDNDSVIPLTLASKEQRTVSVTFPRVVKPGIYNAKVAFATDSDISVDSVVTNYVVSGTTAVINNITLDKDVYDSGDIAVVSYEVTFPFSLLRNQAQTDSFVGSTINIAVVSKTGEKCSVDETFSIDTKNTLQKSNLSMVEVCVSPQVMAVVKDAKGNILTSTQFTFSDTPESKVQIVSTDRSVSYESMLLTILLLLVVGTAGFLIFRKMRRKTIVLDDEIIVNDSNVTLKSLVVFAFLLSSMFLGVNDVKASEYGSDWGWGDIGSGDAGYGFDNVNFSYDFNYTYADAVSFMPPSLLSQGNPINLDLRLIATPERVDQDAVLYVNLYLDSKLGAPIEVFKINHPANGPASYDISRNVSLSNPATGAVGEHEFIIEIVSEPSYAPLTKVDAPSYKNIEYEILPFNYIFDAGYVPKGNIPSWLSSVEMRFLTDIAGYSCDFSGAVVDNNTTGHSRVYELPIATLEGSADVYADCTTEYGVKFPRVKMNRYKTYDEFGDFKVERPLLTSFLHPEWQPYAPFEFFFVPPNYFRAYPTAYPTPYPAGGYNRSTQGCIIEFGEEGCEVVVEWNVEGASRVKVAHKGHGVSKETIIASGPSGSLTYFIKPGSNQAYMRLYNAEKPGYSTWGRVNFAVKYFKASCRTGSSWSGGVCVKNPELNLSISPNPCEIKVNEDTCKTYITWSSDGYSDVALKHRLPDASLAASTQFSTAVADTDVEVTLGHGVAATAEVNKIYFYSNGSVIATRNVSAVCETDTTWDEVALICKADPVSPSSAISIATPVCEIGINQSTCSNEVTWTSNLIPNIEVVHSQVPPHPFSKEENSPLGQSANLVHGLNDFILNDADLFSELKRDTVTVSCVTNTTWNGSVCEPESPKITAPNCPIGNNEDRCQSPVTWGCFGAVPTPRVSQEGTTFAIDCLGGPVNQTILYGETDRFSLNDGTTEIAYDFATASCAGGLDWNVTTLRCQTAPATPVVKLIVDELIRYGGTTDVGIKIQSDAAVDCTLRGATDSDLNIPYAPTANQVTSQISKQFYATQIILLECVVVDFPGIIVSAEARVEVIGDLYEN